MSEISAARKAALWVGVVFLLGAALGAVIGYSYEHHLVSAASTPLPEPVRRARRGGAVAQRRSVVRGQKETGGGRLLAPPTPGGREHRAGWRPPAPQL